MSDAIYTIEEIRDRISPVAVQRSVEKMYLFGSYAKGKATPLRDVDLFVEAPKIHGIFALGGLYGDLEDALEKRIDLITAEALEYTQDRSFVDNLKKERVLLYAAQAPEMGC